MIFAKRPTWKVLFLDISRTLTSEGAAGKRAVDPDAMEWLAAYVRRTGVQKIAFITALSGPSLTGGTENIFPFLERLGVDRISEVFCESGLYQWKNGTPIFTSEAQGFTLLMNRFRPTIDAKVNQRAQGAMDVSRKRGKLAQLRYEFDNPEWQKNKEKNAELGRVISQTIRETGQERQVDVIVTGSGVNLQPKNMNKGIVAGRIVRAWQAGHKRLPRIVGFAIGDFAEEDKLMAISGKVKFVKVREANHSAHWFRSRSLDARTARQHRPERKRLSFRARQEANQAKKRKRLNRPIRRG